MIPKSPPVLSSSIYSTCSSNAKVIPKGPPVLSNSVYVPVHLLLKELKLSLRVLLFYQVLYIYLVPVHLLLK